MSELSSGKILLLDDDTFLVGIYKEKFMEKKYAVQAVFTVDEALRIIRGGFVPDAIIFDLEMKGKDGFVFLQTLREQKLAQGAYLIALTNHSGVEDRAKAIDLGTNRYIVKAEMIPEEVVFATENAIAKLKEAQK